MHRPTLTTASSSHPFDPPPAREGLAMWHVAGLLRRRWAWIVVPTLIATLAAAVFVQVVSPRYTGEAKILLESRDPAFAKTAAERNEQAPPIDEQAVASQVQVVMSRDLAREAIRRLKLVGNPEFDPSGGGIGPIQRVLMLLGLGKNPLDRPPEDRVLEAYYDRLLVFPVGKSRILQIEFRSKDPVLAAEGANTIAELYLASLAAAQVDTARYASTWLGTNIDTLRARVAEAEAKVEAFRAKHGLIGSGGTTNQPLSTQQLGELSSQLSQARTIKADLAARVKLLKEMIKDGRAYEIPDVANNELFRRMVESRMSLRAQHALESRTLLPAHPRIKELTAQLNDLEAQIKSAAERIVRTLENDSKIAGARVESLQSAVDGQRDIVVQGNSNEVQLRALEREAKAQREQLESYLSRYREAAARDAENASPADARIVSRAVVPETPSFPKKIPIIGVSAVLAFLLSAGFVIGHHLLTLPEGPAARKDDEAPAEAEPAPMTADPARLDYPEPLPPSALRPGPRPYAPAAAFENALTARAHVGPAAQSEERSQPAQADADETAASEADATPSDADAYDLAVLVRRLEAAPSHGGRSVLVVETARPSGGRPGLAAGLADLLSATSRVLKVDVTGPAGRPSELGLSDLVAGEAEFPDVIHAVAGSRLHAVRRGFVDSAVLLEEPKGLVIALNAMAQAYEWVICRLDVTEDESARTLLPAIAAAMDSVVIASDAEADDADLVALYGLAEESGAGQVLVARDRTGAPAKSGSDMELRLSA